MSGHCHAERVELGADGGHGRRRRVVVDRDPHAAPSRRAPAAATWRAVASASAVSVFVIDWTTIGWPDPTGTPPTSDGRARTPDGRAHVGHGARSARGMHGGGAIVTDDAANLTPSLRPHLDRRGRAGGRGAGCRAVRGVGRRRIGLSRAAAVPRRAPRRQAPVAVILDWRLEHELSAALFLATRHRYPRMPVIYWTGQRHVAPAGDGAR